MEAPPLLQHPYPVMHSQLQPQPQHQQLQQPPLQVHGQQQQIQQDGYAPPLLQPPANSFNTSTPSLIGQKRDISGIPLAQPSQDSADGGSFVKLFVGSVPRTITEEEVRPMFAEHGNILEVAIIKDKKTGSQQGCCFIKYSTVDEAERAIRALNNQRTLPGGTAPVQVRYADGERERLGSGPALPFCAVEHKLFVGSLNKQASEKEIEDLFSPYGRVDDVYIMRDEQKQSRGCAFIKYPSREMAQAAINSLNGIHHMQGCDQPLAVRFADPKRPKGVDARVGGPGFGGPGFSPRPGQGSQGPRQMQGQIGQMPARGPPVGWRPMGGPGLGPPLQAGSTPYGAPLGPRGGPVTGVPQMGGVIGGPSGNINGHPQGPMSVSGQMMGPGMLPPPQEQGYYPRPQQQSYGVQLGQQQQAYGQMAPAQQQAQAYDQQQGPSSWPQAQPQQQQQQQQQMLAQVQPQQQLQHRPLQAVAQQMSQMQPLQPSQQQMYYQVPVGQPIQQQLQPTWVLPVQPSQPVVSVAAPTLTTPPATCDWTEHTSPEGYKYYYNSTTGESKWEKPEELVAFEQQQQQTQIPLATVMTTPQYSGSAVIAQHPIQGLSYGQSQPINGSVEQPRQQGPPGANLFVFRIPDDFTDETLKDTFAPFGNVISSRVGVERESGRNRGYGFVSYDRAESAESAIQGLNNVPVGGRRLKVERKRGEENGVQGYQQQPY